MTENEVTTQRRVSGGVKISVATTLFVLILSARALDCFGWAYAGFDVGEPIKFTFQTVEPYPNPTPPAPSAMTTCEQLYILDFLVEDEDNWHNGETELSEWDEINKVELQEFVGGEWETIDEADLAKHEDPGTLRIYYEATVSWYPPQGNHTLRLYAEDANRLPAFWGGDGDDDEQHSVSTTWTLRVYTIELTVDSGLPGEACDNNIAVNAGSAYSTAVVNAIPVPNNNEPIELKLDLVPHEDATIHPIADITHTTLRDPPNPNSTTLNGHDIGGYILWAKRKGAACWEVFEWGILFKIEAYIDNNNASDYLEGNPSVDDRPSKEVTPGQSVRTEYDPDAHTEIWVGDVKEYTCAYMYEEWFYVLAPFEPDAICGIRNCLYTKNGAGSTYIEGSTPKKAVPSGPLVTRHNSLYEEPVGTLSVPATNCESFTSEWGGQIIQEDGRVRMRTVPSVDCSFSITASGYLKWKGVNMEASAHSNTKPDVSVSLSYSVFGVSIGLPVVPGAGTAHAKAFLMFDGSLAPADQGSYKDVRAYSTEEGESESHTDPDPFEGDIVRTFTNKNMGMIGGAGISFKAAAAASANRLDEQHEAHAKVTAGALEIECWNYLIGD